MGRRIGKILIGVEIGKCKAKDKRMFGDKN
jgi:hypothetical protein